MQVTPVAVQDCDTTGDQWNCQSQAQKLSINELENLII